MIMAESLAKVRLSFFAAKESEDKKSLKCKKSLDNATFLC